MEKKKLLSILSALARHKYLITIVIGVLFIGFIDENSFMQRVKYDIQISSLKEETVERRFDGENGVIYNNYGFEEKYLKYSTP